MASERKDNITSVINKCADYKKIIIMGLQRAGTHIVSEIITRELVDSKNKYILYKERFFGHTSCEIEKSNSSGTDIEDFIKNSSDYVLQAPSLLYKVEELPEECLVIFINRDKDEIRNSRKRSNWPGKSIELLKYDTKDKGRFYENPTDLVDMQYEYWIKFQKDKIKNLAEIDFDALRKHPFWLDFSKRKDFTIGQTKDNGNWIK